MGGETRAHLGNGRLPVCRTGWSLPPVLVMLAEAEGGGGGVAGRGHHGGSLAVHAGARGVEAGEGDEGGGLRTGLGEGRLVVVGR